MSDDPKLLRAQIDIHRELDVRIEAAQRARQPLRAFLPEILPWIAERLGAVGMMLQTYGESLELETFRWPADLALPGERALITGTDEGSSGYVLCGEAGRFALGQRLDVAGETFGRAAAIFDHEPDADRAHLLLDTACEELDNLLHAVRAARQKHLVTMQLGDALRHRVLADGLREAVAVLGRAVPLERILLTFVAEEEDASVLHVQLHESRDGAMVAKVDTMASEAPREMVDDARRYLATGDRELLRRLDLLDAQEEVLINGVTHSVVVGKVLVSSSAGAFNTWDRELLAAFAGYVRQRVVDFNKEWRRLSSSFRPADVARLVSDDDYERKWLAPREETVAILYVDISGFTRLSEQVLQTPERVAALVEAWSEEAIGLLFQHGGVFDKMVGDCVIGLFGPPFYDQRPHERLDAALSCAVDIREMTRRFPTRPGFEHLIAPGLAVSTGVNLAPLFVGIFGKNDNFTGFSSGMNNTARLQGCAKRDEILVMAEAALALPPGHRFQLGPEESAVVKNVAVPLRYHPVDVR
ncbi:MAG: adenylate/guanylate cyclase domain-containing protein [Myxococcales bacterium]|nr:adenylate/guanylate cyclase domain-containing protein [Myxococcales bacterium]